MPDLSDLITHATETRDRLAAEHARECDRRSGLTAIRPAIDHLEADVLPVLADARDALAAVGITMTIDAGWGEYERTKRGRVGLHCSAGAGWTGNAATAQSRRIFITSTNGRLTVASLPAGVPLDVIPDPDTVDPGAEVASAIEIAVTDFLDAAQRGPLMQGIELRREHGGLTIEALQAHRDEAARATG